MSKQAKNAAKHLSFPVWRAETHVERVRKCASALHLHGYVTDAEMRKIVGRILKAKGEP